MYLRRERTIYIVAGITDMRKQINGLSAIAQEQAPDELFTGCYFVFMGKTRHAIKILYWDRSGFCLWSKKLEEDTFPWTKKRKGILSVDRGRFKLFLKGIDIFREHKKLEYISVA